MKTLLTSVFLSLLFISRSANACSCDWQNVQQAAQRGNVIVALVKDAKPSGHSTSTLIIGKVLKGELKQQTVEVTRNDGSNCAGDVIHDQPSVVLFELNNGRYHVLSCADTALPVDSNGKIKVTLAGKSEQISKAEFSDLINFKVRPTIAGINCGIYVRRHAFGATPVEEKELSIRITKDEKLMGNTFVFRKDYDFSKEGPNIGQMKLAVSIVGTGSSFKTKFMLTEPFFSTAVRAFKSIDIRKTYELGGISIKAYTDYDGIPTDNSDRYLSHNSSYLCSFIPGWPLIPVR
jgi:hypothetical protein